MLQVHYGQRGLRTYRESSWCENLKNNKAAGFDRVLNEHICSTINVFLPVYKKLFNVIFDSGIVPDEWLIGIVKPIYKNKSYET